GRIAFHQTSRIGSELGDGNSGRTWMAIPRWASGHEGGAIVRPVAAPPSFTQLEPPPRPRLKPAAPLHFAMDVAIEPTTRHGKKAVVASPVPNGITFEIHSDEGKAIGGDETAPSPIAYFVSSVGFCLMTHITGYLSFTELDVRGIRIEMRGNFLTTMSHI